VVRQCGTCNVPWPTLEMCQAYKDALAQRRQNRLNLDKKRWAKRAVEKKLKQQRRLEQAVEYRRRLAEEKKLAEEEEERKIVEKKLRVRGGLCDRPSVLFSCWRHRNVASDNWQSGRLRKRSDTGRRWSGTKKLRRSESANWSWTD